MKSRQKVYTFTDLVLKLDSLLPYSLAMQKHSKFFFTKSKNNFLMALQEKYLAIHTVLKNTKTKTFALPYFQIDLFKKE